MAGLDPAIHADRQLGMDTGQDRHETRQLLVRTRITDFKGRTLRRSVAPLAAELAERPPDGTRFQSKRPSISERRAMTIRKLITLIVAAAAVAAFGATLGLGSPAFAWRSDGNRLPSYYAGNGAIHMGRPLHEHAVTPAQRNDWWFGGSHH